LENEFARHGDLDPLALGLGRRSICMVKSMADMMPSPNFCSISAAREAVDPHRNADSGLVGRYRHALTAHRHLVEHRGVGVAWSNRSPALPTCRLVLEGLPSGDEHQQRATWLPAIDAGITEADLRGDQNWEDFFQ
jgi:hypothetical protein